MTLAERKAQRAQEHQGTVVRAHFKDLAAIVSEGAEVRELAAVGAIARDVEKRRSVGPPTCDVCGRAFDNWNSLRGHRSHHRSSSE